MLDKKYIEITKSNHSLNFKNLNLYKIIDVIDNYHVYKFELSSSMFVIYSIFHSWLLHLNNSNLLIEQHRSSSSLVIILEFNHYDVIKRKEFTKYCKKNTRKNFENLRITSIRSDKIKRMMRERDKEWSIDVMSSSSLRERDDIHAKSTSDVNTIEMKKKRNDDAKTMKDLRARIIQITKLYEFRTKKMMNAFDQLIKTSRITRTNDVSSTLKSISTIKKLKKMTTRLKKIIEKKKTHREKSNTWTTIARRDVAMIIFDTNAKKTSTLSSKKELKITIKIIEQKKFNWHKI